MKKKIEDTKMCFDGSQGTKFLRTACDTAFSNKSEETFGLPFRDKIDSEVEEEYQRYKNVL